MTDFAIGDPVEVVVVTKRGKQPEWIPAIVSLVDADKIEVIFEGGSKQKFVADTQRIRTPSGVVEGEQWDFSISSRV